jgi:hypothetical protein
LVIYAKTCTPINEPNIPPNNNTKPILKSTLLRLICTKTPEIDEATTWFAPVATATPGGTPTNSNSGVIKNPPPTPNMPDKKPTMPPSPKRRKALTEISAMGR